MASDFVSAVQDEFGNSGENIKFKLSLPTRVGVESVSEYISIKTQENSEDVRDKIVHNLPSWLKLSRVYDVKNVNVSAFANLAKFEIGFDDYKTLKGAIKDFMEREKILIDVRLHGQNKVMDVKDRIQSYELLEDRLVVLAGVDKQSVRIDQFCKKLLEQIGRKGASFQVVKTGLYFKDDQGQVINVDQILTKMQ